MNVHEVAAAFVLESYNYGLLHTKDKESKDKESKDNFFQKTGIETIG